MAHSVLIVDDIPFVRRALARVITNAGYMVVGEASDGSEALAMYKRLKPDVITMDIVMPKVSGIDATRAIMKEHPEAMVIIISAMGQENLVTEAIQSGAKDYIMKPFTDEEVIRTIERLIESKEGHGKKGPLDHKI